MSIEACARIVERGDPDRFTAIMAGPVSARSVLFAVFAFNIEVARCPWVTQEAMIAEMRLQWWHDALGEIANGGEVRRHEVVTPLAQAISSSSAETLTHVVEARRWDIYPETFRSQANISSHIERGSGKLYEATAAAFGAQKLDSFRYFGISVGIAHWLKAVAELKSRNRHPLHDERDAAIISLANEGLDWWHRARREITDISPNIKALLLTGWQTEALLKKAAANPQAVRSGVLQLAPIHAKLRLMITSAKGRL